MNKDRFYQFVILILILLLGLFIGKSLMQHKRPPSNRGQGPKQVVIDRLNLDEAQVKSYMELIDKHRSTIKSMDKEIRDKKKSLYTLLNLNTQPVLVDSITSEIALIHKQIEEAHFEHFQDIRALCRKNQMELYEDLAKDLAKIFSRKPPKRR